MSLFPAYSSTSSSNETKTPLIKSETNDKNSDKQKSYDWLSLSSFDDKKVVQLNNEIIVDKSKLEERNKDKNKNTDRHRRSDYEKRSSDHRSDRRRYESKSSERKHSSKSSSSTDPTLLGQLLANKTFIDETGLSPENAFRFDKKRDKNNFVFNSLYYKNVANYDKNKTINTLKRKRSKNEVLGQKSKKMRYFSHENRFKLSKTSEDLTDLSKPVMRPMIEPLDFIAVTSNQPFTQLSLSSSNPLGVYDNKTALWAEGKDLIEDTSAPKSLISFQSMKEENDKNEIIGPNRAPTREQYIYEKTQEFNAYLRDNETDIQKWLKFIEFQDKCVEPIDSTKDKIDGKTIESVVSEKKLSICEKALSFNPKSIELLLCRLEIGANLWDFEKVSKEWKQLAFLYPNSMEMWKKYIEFSHQNITNFSSSKTLKIYEKCVQILSKMLEKTFKSHIPPENLEQQLVSVLSSYTQFLRSIGQTERAVSTFQALIEFNLFTPSLLNFQTSLQDWISLFEPFWDSGCARFGEDEAIGWSQVMLKKNIANNCPKISELQSFINSEENKIISEKCDKSLIWLKFELLRQRFHWLPARETVDQEVEDPERVVCSDDITHMLVRLREQDSKYKLVKEFLRFLGASDKNCIKSDDLSDISLEIPNFSIDLPLFPPFFNHQNVIQNIFKTSLPIFSGELKSDLVLNWIKYEKNKTSDNLNSKQMRKFFKDFLRDECFRNDLSIWSEFATFEYYLTDNQNEGRKVFRTAIELTLNLKKNNEKLFKFVRNYVELELQTISLSQMSENMIKSLPNDSKIDELCLNSMLSVCLGKVVTSSTPALVLKAINYLKQNIETNKDYLFCLVFINYLTKGISQSIQVIEEQLATNKCSEDEKQLYSLYLKVLLLNIGRNFGQSLRPLRSVVERALYSYPTEPQFLTLFINLEFKSNVLCRMRNFFSKTYHSVVNEGSFKDNLTLIMFAIHSELLRLDAINETFSGYDTNSGIVNRVRGLFEKSVSSGKLSNCLTLWRLYLKFEINCKNINKAKSVFYRGLQNCAFSKILFMDGIQYFPQKLQEFLDIMTEKELRIRTPLEEIDLLVNNLA